LEQRLLDWLNSFDPELTYFIPCAILSDVADPFSIGPVRFVHIETFDPSEYLIVEWERASAPIRRSMDSHSAKWLGITKVAGCEPSRSEEIPEFTVDIALAALQLVLPEFSARNIARITTRAMLPHKGTLVTEANGHWRGMNTVTEPGLGLIAKDFNEMILQATPDLTLIGRRIDAYRTGTASLPVLEQAWCDAAFWYHEAFSEPLDTVATAKLETAIENLFAAGSVSESKARLVTAFRYLLRLERNAKLNTALPVTVNQFINSIVTARSRILHGTCSTLTRHDLEVERRDVMTLARSLLLLYPKVLHAYAATGSPKDNVREMLEWLVRTSSAATLKA
jgi:hypothetical protein